MATQTLYACDVFPTNNVCPSPDNMIEFTFDTDIVIQQNSEGVELTLFSCDVFPVNNICPSPDNMIEFTFNTATVIEAVSNSGGGMTDMQLDILTSTILVVGMGICLCIGFLAGQKMSQ